MEHIRRNSGALARALVLSRGSATQEPQGLSGQKELCIPVFQTGREPVFVIYELLTQLVPDQITVNSKA
jgi:hypothetical protein